MPFKGKGRVGTQMSAGLRAKPSFSSRGLVAGKWGMVCFDGGILWELKAEFQRIVARLGRDYALDFADKQGAIKWAENWNNIIVNAGRDYAADAALSGGTQITSWFVGLVNGATPTFALTDTMASHAGWTEEQSYDEATRVAWVEAGVSAGSVTNSASVATFTINASVTIGGAFLVSNNTKGGTTGTLYAEGDFATDRSVEATDVLDVTATMTLADDGV